MGNKKAILKPIESEYGLDPFKLERKLRKILLKINSKIFKSKEKKIVINDIWINNEIHINLNRRGFYRPPKKIIQINCDWGTTNNEAIEIFLHELAHAYQHQIIPHYYINFVPKFHDDVFFKVNNRFLEIFRKGGKV